MDSSACAFLPGRHFKFCFPGLVAFNVDSIFRTQNDTFFQNFYKTPSLPFADKKREQNWTYVVGSICRPIFQMRRRSVFVGSLFFAIYTVPKAVKHVFVWKWSIRRESIKLIQRIGIVDMPECRDTAQKKEGINLMQALSYLSRDCCYKKLFKSGAFWTIQEWIAVVETLTPDISSFRLSYFFISCFS
jgi:hypothetical protein